MTKNAQKGNNPSRNGNPPKKGNHDHTQKGNVTQNGKNQNGKRPQDLDEKTKKKQKKASHESILVTLTSTPEASILLNPVHPEDPHGGGCCGNGEDHHHHHENHHHEDEEGVEETDDEQDSAEEFDEFEEEEEEGEEGEEGEEEEEEEEEGEEGEGEEEEEGSSVLEPCLHPMTVEAFLSEIYTMKALIINGRGTAWLSSLEESLADLSLPMLLQDVPPEAISVWVASQRTKVSSRIEVKTPVDAMACYSSGASLHLPAPEQVGALYRGELFSDLGANFGCLQPDGNLRGEAEIWAMRSGYNVGWHIEDSEVFLFQLKGTSSLKIRPGPAKNPAAAYSPHLKQPDLAEQQLKVLCASAPTFGSTSTGGQEAEETVLEPGAFVYLPSGVFRQHGASEDAVIFALKLRPLSWGDLLKSAIATSLLSIPSNRAGIFYATEDEARVKAGHALRQAKEIINSLTVDDLLPPALDVPREIEVAVSETDQFGDLIVNSNLTLFTRSPVSVLIKDKVLVEYNGPEVGSGLDSDHMEEDEDEDEDEQPEGVVLVKHLKYVLHSLFAGEESHLRVVLYFHPNLEGFVDWVISRPAGAKFLLSDWKGTGVEMKELKKAMRVLAFNGFIRVTN